MATIPTSVVLVPSHVSATVVIAMAANAVTAILMPAILSAILSPPATFKAAFAPTMFVSPVCPGTDAQEDAIVEVTVAVKSVRRTRIRLKVIVAVQTHRLFNNYNINAWASSKLDRHLCRRRRHEQS